ncbi:MAG: hypothetical protein ACI4NG_01855, partial [Candidatus Gallimonas sp.]
MEEITVSERRERRFYITYLCNAVTETLSSYGGIGEMVFGESRTALRLTVPKNAERAVRTC